MSPPSHAVPLEVRRLSLSRAGRRVLQDVSTTFPRSTVSVVVGPSGAGKTSFLRCLNRLEEPDAGSVLLDGRDLRTLDPTVVRQRVGMIFQTPVLFEGGVKGDLAYGLPGLSEDDMEAALVAAGLDRSFLQRESSALSIGEAQRVCIARALVRDPEVLLMDEPTSALDRDAAARIEALIRSLAETGLAVVLVTHNFLQAKRVGDRALLLAQGLVLANGTVEEVETAWPGEELV